METPLLSVAMIVKNEEEHLPNCLASLEALRPVLHDVCIYDTGSTDRTVELAREWGATVVEGYWDDDFSRARNEALAMCQGRWILSIDADEQVHVKLPQFKRVLRQALTQAMVGFDLLHPQMSLVQTDGLVHGTYFVARILRANRTKFFGKVHELARPINEDKKPLWMQVDPSVFRLTHHGYRNEVMVAKGERNTALAEIEVAEADGTDIHERARALMNRARSRALTGDLKGELEDLDAIWSLPHAAGLRCWAGEALTDRFISLGQLEHAKKILSQLPAAGSNPQLVSWLKARIHLVNEEWGPALELLRAIDVRQHASGLSSNSEELLQARMMAAGRMGEREEAAACLTRLMASYGKTDGYGSLLLTLWGNKPESILVDLLRAADRGFLSQIADELDKQRDPGPAIAAALRDGRSMATSQRTASTSS